LRYDDVWILDHASGVGGTPTWVEVNVAGASPAERSEHVAAYDVAHNRMIIFGGDEAPGTPLNDLWVLAHADGNGGTSQWVKLKATGTPPSATGFEAATYDPKSNRLTVFGGSVCCSGPAFNDVWVVTNANGLGGTPQWTHLSPSGTPPSPRAGAKGMYTSAANVALYFGGSGTNDLWRLTGANGMTAAGWSQLTPRGVPPPGRGGVVANATVVTDSASGRSIFFGGAGANGMLNDTWNPDVRRFRLQRQHLCARYRQSSRAGLRPQRRLQEPVQPWLRSAAGHDHGHLR
jgi:hypothetical protein